jgi:hypothetical protein
MQADCGDSESRYLGVGLSSPQCNVGLLARIGVRRTAREKLERRLSASDSNYMMDTKGWYVSGAHEEVDLAGRDELRLLDPIQVSIYPCVRSILFLDTTHLCGIRPLNLGVCASAQS